MGGFKIRRGRAIASVLPSLACHNALALQTTIGVAHQHVVICVRSLSQTSRRAQLECTAKKSTAMPKRKKRRQSNANDACTKAMQHYEAALRNLEDADEPRGARSLDFAEVFLERAQDDDVRRGLVAEVSPRAGRPARGRRSEQRAPRVRPELFSGRQRGGGCGRRASTMAQRRRREAACAAGARARRGGGRRGSPRRRGGAAGALSRGARAGPRGARELAELGYDRTFSRKALTNALNARPCDVRALRAALRRRPARQTPWRRSGAPKVVGGVLLARDGLRLARRRLFSFTQPNRRVVRYGARRCPYRCLARRRQSPAGGARIATYVEWWAHTRRRGDGHAIMHCDSVPGLTGKTRRRGTRSRRP